MPDAVVFDCMIFLPAAARPERVRPAWQAVHQGRLNLYISGEILAEIKDVLTRPKLRRRFPALAPEAVARFIDDIVKHATLLADVPEAFLLHRDPDDSKYVNLAIAAEAKYLVTRDRDLLDLARPEAAQAVELKDKAPDLRILTPEDLHSELQREQGVRVSDRPDDRG